MSSKLKFTPKIEWLLPNTIERSAHKTKLIEKAYEKKV